MNNTIRKLGYWSSAVSLTTFLLYTLCFVANYAANPSFVWTNSGDFIAYASTHNQVFKHIAMALMLVFSLSFLVQLECLRESVGAEKQFFVRTAIHFAIAFAVLIGINYFVQIGAIRLQMLANRAEGIAQFVQSNPNSFINAVNLLGWTVFLGLACIFASPAMGKGRIERIIKISLLANGFMMLLSSVAYIFSITIVQALFLFIGLGAAIIVESAAMCAYFKRYPPVR
ncbi:MAG: hypothetical protein AAGU74_01440 [Bacillota bacterium]